jgi:K+-sensing histidine kinase KdpD
MQMDDAFLGRVTHDLRGELATMVAGIHYLLRYEAGLGAAGRQMAERVNGAGQRLGRLIDELELAAWIAGSPAGFSLSREACSLEGLVRAAIGRLSGSIAQRKVKVEVDVPPGGAEIEVDPELYGVAIEHALDFVVARSPDRTVRVRADEAGTLSMTDAGGEVEPGTLARIFEPFVERELVPRPEPGGRRRERLGLGLAIARGIVRAHGGATTATTSGEGVAITLAPTVPARAGCHAPPSV